MSPRFDTAPKLVIEFAKDPPRVVYPPRMWQPKRLTPILNPVRPRTPPEGFSRFLRSDQ